VSACFPCDFSRRLRGFHDFEAHGPWGCGPRGGASGAVLYCGGEACRAAGERRGRGTLTTTAIDFDSPWKEALDEHLEDFFALFFPQAHAEIDWARGGAFLDAAGPVHHVRYVCGAAGYLAMVPLDRRYERRTIAI